MSFIGQQKRNLFLCLIDTWDHFRDWGREEWLKEKREERGEREEDLGYVYIEREGWAMSGW